MLCVELSQYYTIASNKQMEIKYKNIIKYLHIVIYYVIGVDKCVISDEEGECLKVFTDSSKKIHSKVCKIEKKLEGVEEGQRAESPCVQ